MLNGLKKFFEFSATKGLYLPTAHDARVKRGSISLLFAYISFFTALCGIIALMQINLILGVYCAMGYSALMLVFYLMRSLTKVKADKSGFELTAPEGLKDE